ncbi:MAG: DUF6452 family protein [Alloprevotella sp.]
MKRILQPTLIGIAAMLLGACTNIDCPLDNVVMMQCGIYDAETEQPLTLPVEWALSVKPAGRDTILLNRAYGVESFLLPLKEGEEKDTLLFFFAPPSTNTGEEEGTEEGEETENPPVTASIVPDTLFVTHTRTPHFESVDCPASVFHNITDASTKASPQNQLRWTLERVKLVRTTVNYDDIENLRIYLRTTDEQ